MSNISRSRHEPGALAPRHDRIRASRPQGSDGYCRERDLPHLIPVLAEDLQTPSRERHQALLTLIRRALRAERRRAKVGDWSYDLGRHAALLTAYRQELRQSREPPMKQVVHLDGRLK